MWWGRNVNAMNKGQIEDIYIVQKKKTFRSVFVIQRIIYGRIFT